MLLACVKSQNWTFVLNLAHTALVIHIRVSFHCCATAFNDGEPVGELLFWVAGLQRAPTAPEKCAPTLWGFPASLHPLVCLHQHGAMAVQAAGALRLHRSLHTHAQIVSLKPHFKRRSVTIDAKLVRCFPVPIPVPLKANFLLLFLFLL